MTADAEEIHLHSTRCRVRKQEWIVGGACLPFGHGGV